MPGPHRRVLRVLPRGAPDPAPASGVRKPQRGPHAVRGGVSQRPQPTKPPDGARPPWPVRGRRPAQHPGAGRGRARSGGAPAGRGPPGRGRAAPGATMPPFGPRHAARDCASASGGRAGAKGEWRGGEAPRGPARAAPGGAGQPPASRSARPAGACVLRPGPRQTGRPRPGPPAWGSRAACASGCWSCSRPPARASS